MSDSPGLAAEATARQLAGIGQFDAALTVLARVMADGLSDDPGYIPCAMLSAAICHHLGRYASAFVPLARILAIDPAQPNAIGNLALMLPPAMDAAAWRWHQRAVQLAPMDIQILVNAGLRAIGRAGQPPAITMDWFKRAAILDPARPEVFGALGMIRAGLGDAIGAISPYHHAALLVPMAFIPRFMLGSARQSAGLFDQAEADYAQAARLKWQAKTSAPRPESHNPRLGLGWKPGFEAGWDVYGANLVKRLLSRGDIDPVVVNPIIAGPDDQGPFADLFAWSLDLVMPGLESRHDFPCLIGLGNDFARHPCIGRSRREIGVIFLEDTNLSAAGRARAEQFDLIIAGATWGAEVLAGMGLPNVKTVLQGIDPSLFSPDRRKGRSGRFRIFSGGKLEFRKGQDLVIRAFAKFHERYPDSQLVLAWQSPWPSIARSITWAGLVDTSPAIGPDHRLQLGLWLEQLGLQKDAVDILGLLPNHQMPEILSTVDCALFPNRCEGGTNLVAMEAMAAGVPVILSANTGHLDLIEGDNCLALYDQKPVAQPRGISQKMGLVGWGESSIDEIIGHLEILYHDHARARTIGLAGAQRLSRLTWPGQIDRLIEAIGPLS